MSAAATPADGSVAADSPMALMRPDDLIAALAELLRRIHGGPAGIDASGRSMPDAGADVWLRRVIERSAAGDVDPSLFDAPYRGQAPERLAEIASSLHERLAPIDPCPVVGPVALDEIRLAAGRVVDPAAATAMGDPYLDLSWLANRLVGAVGAGAVPALFDAYGIEAPDPVRVEFWILVDQLARPHPRR